MPRNAAKPPARKPANGLTADVFDASLQGRSLLAGFRPIADFGRCEILGHIAGVRGPVGMLHGSFACLARVAHERGLLGEFSGAAAETIVARFVESNAKGLLFLPLAAAAVQRIGPALADGIAAAVAAFSFAPERVVVMLPGLDTAGFAQTVATAGLLRAEGFGLAAGGPGCSHNERLLVSELAPDFMLLDEHLFDGIDLSAAAQDDEIAAQIEGFATGSRIVVADGIGTAADLQALRRLGIACGAGDFIGRVCPLPTRAMSAAAHKAIASGGQRDAAAQAEPAGVLERLLTHSPPVAPTTCAEDVFLLFERDAEQRAIAVVDEGVPRGLISRYEMIDNMARPYRHELYGRKPCTRFMDAHPLVVDIATALPDLVAIVVGADPRHLISGFIITERDRYLGMGSVQDLVREVTAMQMEAARYANPLTQLPGNVPINQHIDNLLAAGETCCIAYCDLDHFKPFNDAYGYALGDEVIRLTARVLVAACATERDFVGHVGGDDFVVILRSSDWEARCREALERFGAEILGFFSNDDIARGGYVTENRKGEPEFHRLTSLSIGAIPVAPGMFANHLQVSKVAAEVKKQAKAIVGNSLFVNQRLYGVQKPA